MVSMTVVKHKIDIADGKMEKNVRYPAKTGVYSAHKVWVLWGLPEILLKSRFDGGRYASAMLV